MQLQYICKLQNQLVAHLFTDVLTCFGLSCQPTVKAKTCQSIN